MSNRFLVYDPTRLGISSTVKGGSIQLVWDLETFEVGMYAGGGISVGTNCVSAVDVSVEVGICYKGENSGRELDSGGYGGFGLSVDVGVDVGVAGVSAIFGVDASIATKEDSDKLDITTLAPNWNAGKALAVGVGVGILLAWHSLGASLGALLGGSLFDEEGNYQSSLVLCALLCVVASVVVV